MRVLIIHPEANYFAGAEMMLLYYLEGLASADCQVVTASAMGSKLAGLIPSGVEQIYIPDNEAFSIPGLKRQLTDLLREHRLKPFDLIHGWAARDWELTALLGWQTRRPTLGTLHDHPRARFISWKRRGLMRWCARRGLGKVACVSEAVRSACLLSKYPARKLEVVHNGLPMNTAPQIRQPDSIFRIGFLGAFSERKGLQTLFAILAELATITDTAWEMHLAGSAQEKTGQKLLDQIRQRYSGTRWWSRIHWRGWMERPLEFLRTVELLVVPSAEFDPFPTVLLEAASAGVPALAAKVGGVPEIVVHDETGWLFDPGDPPAAARILRHAVEHPDECRQRGKRALARSIREFTVGKMVARYLNLYSTLLTNV